MISEKAEKSAGKKRFPGRFVPFFRKIADVMPVEHKNDRRIESAMNGSNFGEIQTRVKTAEVIPAIGTAIMRLKSKSRLKSALISGKKQIEKTEITNEK